VNSLWLLLTQLRAPQRMASVKDMDDRSRKKQSPGKKQNKLSGAKTEKKSAAIADGGDIAYPQPPRKPLQPDILVVRPSSGCELDERLLAQAGDDNDSDDEWSHSMKSEKKKGPSGSLAADSGRLFACCWSPLQACATSSLPSRTMATTFS